jgi:hypothetical protein
LGAFTGFSNWHEPFREGYSLCVFRGHNGSTGKAHDAARYLEGRMHVMKELTMEQAELEKVHVEIVKLMAEQRKLNAEAGKMTRETFWYPVAVATGLIGMVATVTTVLVKLL